MNNANDNSNKKFSGVRTGRHRIDTRGENIGCNEADVTKFYNLFEKDSKIIPFQDFNLSDFYHWFDQLHCAKKEIATVYTGKEHRYRIKYTGEQSRVMVIINGSGNSKKEQFYSILKQMYGGVTQQMMEGTPESGLDNQDVTKATTTIITADTGIESISINKQPEITLKKLCNTEDSYEMPVLTNRYEILETGVITADSDFSKQLVLPRDLFKSAKKNSANLLLFKNFIYSDLEMEMRVIVNAPKFGQGRLVCSWFPDPHDNVGEQYDSPNSMVQRPHVFIDLNGVNQASLFVPKIYRRTFVRNFAHESAAQGLPYAQLFRFQMATISQYKTGTGQPTTINYTIEYRFVKLELAGISFGVELQMDKMIELAGDIYPPVRTAEKYLKRFGVIGNQDKPYDANNIRVTPTPRINLCNGKGVSDAIPLQFDGLATVSTLGDYINADDPTDVLEIAKKWGLRATATWSTNLVSGNLIHSIPITPCYHDIEDKAYNKTPTPLDYIASGYAFWRGTIKYKIQFVSTPFHTGSLQAQISFGRIGDNNFANTNVYTKIFDLGMTTEFEITAPYIYDTPWRRCSGQLQLPLECTDDSSYSIKDNELYTKAIPFPMASDFVSNTILTMRVINPLVPIQNVSSVINILIFVCAGDDFELRSVVPNYFTNPKGMTTKDRAIRRFKQQLPIYEDNAIKGSFYEDGVQVPRLKRIVKQTEGCKEEIKLQSDDFNTGNPVKHFHSTDEDTTIKTLMRRNYHVGCYKFGPSIETKKPTFANSKIAISCSGFNHYWFPVVMPTHLTGTNLTGAQASPLATLSTLFRHWRGSMRYTFVFRNTLEPIYVSYAPNLGVKYYGEIFQPARIDQVGDQTLSRYISNFRGNMSSLGFATEIVIPGINPTIAISVPFDCMFNMCVNVTRKIPASGENINRCFAREDVTDMSGHVIIQAAEGTEVDVFQSVGDDHMMHNFVGTLEYDQPTVYNFPDDYYRYVDPKHVLKTKKQGHFKRTNNTMNMGENLLKEVKTEEATKQHLIEGLTKPTNSDFQGVDLCQKTNDRFIYIHEQIFDETKNTVTDIKKSASNMAESMAQFVETSKNIAANVEIASGVVNVNMDKIGTASMGLDASMKTIASATDDMKETVKLTKEKVEEITKTFGEESKGIMSLLRPVLEKINNLLPNAGNLGAKIAEYTSDFIFDLIILIKDFSLSTFAIMIVKYISKILFVNFESIVSYAEKLSIKIKELYIKLIGAFSSQSKSEEPSGVGLFSFFTSMIAGICKLTCMSDKKTYDHGSKFGDFIFDNRNVSYVNGVMTLVERTIHALVSAIKWCSTAKEVEPTMREYFKENQTELIDFMSKVDEMMDPANKNLLRRPDVKARVFTTYMEAKAIIKKLALMAGNSAANLLIAHAKKYINFVQDLWCDLSCSPVRMEPRVLCIEGPSNIGKSFLTQHLAPMLIRELGWLALGQNPIYTRSPGKKFWDGYGGQPIILYDDWLNLDSEEIIVATINELYEFKSPCDFIPPRASLNEKNEKISPLLSVLLCNDAFPRKGVENILRHPHAVWRRRDLLLRARAKAGVDPASLRRNNRELDKPNFDHIEFALDDPTKSEERASDDSLTWMNFEETFEYLKRDMIDYYEDEKIIAKHRLKEFCKDLPPQIVELSDPVANFNYRVALTNAEANAGTKMLPGKKLELEIKEVIKKVEEIYKTEGFTQQIDIKKVLKSKFSKGGMKSDLYEQFVLLPLHVKADIINHLVLSKIYLEKTREIEDHMTLNLFNNYWRPKLQEYAEYRDVKLEKFYNFVNDEFELFKSDKTNYFEHQFTEAIVYALNKVNHAEYIRPVNVVGKYCNNLDKSVDPMIFNRDTLKLMNAYAGSFQDIVIKRVTTDGVVVWEDYHNSRWADFQEGEEVVIAIKNYDELTHNVVYVNMNPKQLHEFVVQYIDKHPLGVDNNGKKILRSYNSVRNWAIEVYERNEYNSLKKNTRDRIDKLDDTELTEHEYIKATQKYRGNKFELYPDSQQFEKRHYNDFDDCEDREFVEKCNYEINNILTTEMKQSLQQTALVNDKFFIDSIIGKRQFLDIKTTERRRMANRIVREIEAGRQEVDPGVEFHNVHIACGVRMSHFAQEVLDPSMNGRARASLLNCHHCGVPNLLSYGNDEHHICGDCATAKTVCEYCAVTKVDKTLRMKSFWYCLRYGTLLYKTKEFITWVWNQIPTSLQIMIEVCGGLICYLGCFVGLMMCVSGEQSDDASFNRNYFDKMMAQRANYVDCDECMHESCFNLDEASYSNGNWIIPNTLAHNLEISVFPCKRNCVLFDGKNKDRYRKECYKFAVRQAAMTTGLYEQALMETNLYMRCYTQIPPFSRRATGVPYVAIWDDKFENERLRPYKTILDKCIMGANSIFNLNPTASKLKTLAKLGLGLISIVASIRGIFSFVGYIKEKCFTKTEQATSYDGGAQRHFYKERQTVKQAKLSKPGVVSQSDSNYFEVLYTKLHKNTLNLRIINLENNYVENDMLAIGLRNRYAVMPKHYFRTLERASKREDCKIILIRPYYPEISVEYIFDMEDFVVSDVSDLAIMRAPKTINDFINITGYMAKFDDFSGVLPRRAMFFRGSTMKSKIPFTTAVNLQEKLEAKVDLVDSELDHLQGVLAYNYSENGACGSCLLRTGNQRPIIGMHVAGSHKNSFRTRGFAVILYREMLDHIILDTDIVDNSVNNLEDNMGEAKLMFPDGVYLQSLHVNNVAIHIPSKTKIKESLIHDYDGEAKTKPCYLSKREPGYKHDISPLMAGCMKHGKLTNNFKTGDLLEVTNALYDAKYRSMQPLVMQPERLTIKQAITGMDVDGYESLKLDTSAGWPFVVSEDKQKKDYIFVSDHENRELRKVEMRETCLQHLLEMQDLRLAGIRPTLYYVDELKDQRKEIEKRDKLGATRVFCMSPLSTTIAVRQNFLHFAAAYKAGRINLQHAVGISTDGPEWGQLANYLLSVSNNIITLDYSNFGPGYNAGVNACGHDIIQRWTTKYVKKINQREMSVLGEEHYNSIHIMHNLVYRQLNGGPSGDGLTVQKNGLVNELYLLLAWKFIIGNIDNLYGEFFDNVRLITYGDDAIMSVSDKYIEQFNGITISELFAKFNIVATDAEKSGAMVKFRSLLESTFLKSGFKKHPMWPGEYLAPVEKLSIEETPRWIFPSEDDGCATEFNAEQALRLSYGHGTEYFDKFKEKLNDALGDAELKPILVTWKELDKNFFPKYYE